MFKKIFTEILGPVSIICAFYFFYLLFSVSVFPDLPLFFRGFDTYWLIKQGAWILQNLQIPHENVLTIHGSQFSSMDWVCYQWLFSIITGFLYINLGKHGLIWFCSAILAVIAGLWGYILYKRNFRGFPEITLSLLIIIIPLTVFADIRPFIITIFYGTVLQLLLLYFKKHLTRWFVMPLLFILWANSHLGFVFGIAWLFIEMIIASKKEHSIKPLLCWGVCFLSTSLNPRGFYLYKYLADLWKSPYMNSNIAELKPFGLDYDPLMQIVIFLGIFALFYTLKSDKIRLAEKIMCAAAFIMIFVSVRHINFLLLFIPVFYAALINKISCSFMPVTAKKFNLFSMKNDKLYIVIPVMLFTGLIFTINKTFEIPETPKIITPGLIKHLKKNEIKKPVLTTGEIGSELLFYTKTYALLDTRYDMYGDEYVKENYSLLNLSGNWKENMKKRKINYIIYPNSYKKLPCLKCMLIKNHWKESYSDNKILLLSKKH